MKDSLLVSGAVFLSLAVLAAATWILPARAHQPFPATCRILDCDPEFHTGHDVRLPTDGMQPGDTPRETVYRTFASKPPVVVCRWRGTVPDKLPSHIVGVCRGRQGAAVVVEDCH